MVGVVAGLCTLKANVLHDLVFTLTWAVGVTEDHLGRQAAERRIKHERPSDSRRWSREAAVPQHRLQPTLMFLQPASLVTFMFMNARRYSARRSIKGVPGVITLLSNSGLGTGRAMFLPWG